MGDQTPNRVQQRRALEALRSGVPNRDAVRVLGAAQQAIEEAFLERLEQVSGGTGSSEPQPGVLVAGGFGTGKSHLLEFLRHLALDRNFVCSKLAVSKEMPLYDVGKVFRAAVSSIAVPGETDVGLDPIALKLRWDASEYTGFFHWVNGPESRLDPMFQATLYLFEYDTADEFRRQVVGFWAGDKLSVTECRKKLRENGQLSTYRLGKLPAAKELALQRFRFASGLIQAAGFKGWVLLVDEAELIASYSRLQRGRSYAEVARYLQRLVGETLPGLTSVIAITDDFASRVLDQRGDRDQVPNYLEARGDVALANQARTGMRLLERDRRLLRPPDPGQLRTTYERVKQTHGDAYGWSPPDVAWPEQLTTRPMRAYVRSWINEWDLKRAYPDYEAEIEVTPLEQQYEEDPDIERPLEGDEGRGDDAPAGDTGS